MQLTPIGEYDNTYLLNVIRTPVGQGGGWVRENGIGRSPVGSIRMGIIGYARTCVWRCCKFCKFASLPSVFSLFLFSVCCFRMGPFLFPSLYARANIIMCLSFSSGVLRYKNMLCNTSVIQCITKKFQEIRIIFPSYVCWLSLKGLPLHPQSREMRHFRQCVTDLVKQT